MKSLITALTLVIIAIVSYPTISDTLTNMKEAKSAQLEQVKSLCDSNVKTKWVKLEGSLTVFKCEA
jgi:hypothetical protein